MPLPPASRGSSLDKSAATDTQPPPSRWSGPFRGPYRPQSSCFTPRGRTDLVPVRHLRSTVCGSVSGHVSMKNGFTRNQQSGCSDWTGEQGSACPVSARAAQRGFTSAGSKGSAAKQGRLLLATQSALNLFPGSPCRGIPVLGQPGRSSGRARNPCAGKTDWEVLPVRVLRSCVTDMLSGSLTAGRGGSQSQGADIQGPRAGVADGPVWIGDLARTSSRDGKMSQLPARRRRRSSRQKTGPIEPCGGVGGRGVHPIDEAVGRAIGAQRGPACCRQRGGRLEHVWH